MTIIDSKSFVFEQNNETDNLINMDIRKTLTGNLLSIQELQDYSMSITRLSLPTTNIDQLYIPDSEISKYTVALKMYSKYLGTHVTYTKSLPNQNSHEITYHSKERIIEMINRALNNCYSQHYENVSIVDTNMRVVLPVTTTTFTTASPLSSNLSVSSSYSNFAGIKLRILSAITKTTGGDNDLMRLFIQTGAVKQYLYCGSIKNFVDKSGNGNFDITENSFRDWNSNFDARNSNNVDVKAYESYLKFKNSAFSGHLNVGIECSGNFNIAFQYQVTLFLSDNETMCSQSPFISYNSNNKLNLNIQNFYYKLNNQIASTAFLSNAFDFTTITKSTSIVNGVKLYFIEYDAMLLDDTLTDLIILTQDHQTLERLSNISEIQLRSSALSAVSENLISNSNVPISNNVLYEFIVFKDISIGNQLLFSEPSETWRRIDVSKLKHTLRNVDFSLYAQYENGYSKAIQMSPSETWSLRLSFTRS